jgi:hypothetical protein
VSVRDNRKPPFAWVSLAALEAIERGLPRTRQASARNAYLALAQAASSRADHDHREGDPLESVARFACVSSRRLGDHLRDLAGVGLVHIETRRDEVGRDLASHYVILDAPRSDESSDRGDNPSDRSDGSGDRLAADLSSVASGPTRAGVTAVDVEEERDEVTDEARVRALGSVPVSLSDLEVQAVEELADLVAARGGKLTEAHRAAIVAASRAAADVDPFEAARGLSRYYGRSGRGAEAPITDIAALFTSEVGRRRRAPVEAPRKFEFRKPAGRRSIVPAAVVGLPADLERPGKGVIEAWQQVRDHLRASAPESTWAIYLEPLELAGFTTSLVTELDDSVERPLRTLYLTAPVEKVSTLETHHLRFIRGWVAHVFGAELPVRIVEAVSASAVAGAAA